MCEVPGCSAPSCYTKRVKHIVYGTYLVATVHLCETHKDEDPDPIAYAKRRVQVNPFLEALKVARPAS